MRQLILLLFGIILLSSLVTEQVNGVIVGFTSPILYDDEDFFTYGNFTNSGLSGWENNSQYRVYKNGVLIQNGTLQQDVYFSFDENFNTSDGTGTLNGIYTGASLVLGKYGTAIFINESGQGLRYNISNRINWRNGGVSFWYNSSHFNDSTANRFLMGVEPSVWYIKQLKTSMQMIFENDEYSQNVCSYSPSTASWTGYHHFFLTWRNGRCELFVDGVTYGNPVTTNWSNYNLSKYYNSTILNIGMNYWDKTNGTYHLNGSLDDIRFWDFDQEHILVNETIGSSGGFRVDSVSSIGYYSGYGPYAIYQFGGSGNNIHWISEQNFTVGDTIQYGYKACNNASACVDWQYSDVYTVQAKNVTITVYLNESIGNNPVRYGAQEAGHDPWYISDSNYSVFYSELGYNNIRNIQRMWIYNRSYNPEVIPWKGNCSGTVIKNWTNYDAYLSRILSNNLTPYITSAWAPQCPELGNGSWGGIPNNFTLYGIYFTDLINHSYTMCTNGSWTNCGNFSNWYWETWNEPSRTGFWGAPSYNFSDMYNKTATKVRAWSITTGIPVKLIPAGDIGASHVNEFFTYLNGQNIPDAFSVHWYSNFREDFCTPWDNYTSTQHNFSTKPVYKMLNDVNTWYNSSLQSSYIFPIKSYCPNCEIFNFEYNIDANYNPTNCWMNTPQGASWFMSSIYWQIKNGNISGVSFFGIIGQWQQTVCSPYPGSCSAPTYDIGTFNMIGSAPDYNKTITYNQTRVFNNNVRFNQTLYQVTSDNSKVEVLATQNATTIINKLPGKIKVNIQFVNRTTNWTRNYLTGVTQQSSTGILLEAYSTTALEYISLPEINYVFPTPENNAWIFNNTNNLTINATITNINILSNVVYSIDNTSTSVWDSAITLYLGFNTNESNNTWTPDKSGNGRNGTGYNVTYMNGSYNLPKLVNNNRISSKSGIVTSYNFTIDIVMSFARPPVLNPTTTEKVDSVFVQNDATGGARRILLYRKSNASTSGTNGTWELDFYNSTRGSVYVGISTCKAQDTNIHHYILTADTNNITFYADGVLCDTRTTQGGVWINTTTTYDNINFGESFGSALNGTIYEIIIYNRTLSKTEVMERFNYSFMDNAPGRTSWLFTGVKSILTPGLHNYSLYVQDSNGNTTLTRNVSIASCTYSGSGDWNIVGGCNLTINTNMLGNNVWMTCPNYINVYANITNYTDAFQFGSCNVSSFGYGGFK